MAVERWARFLHKPWKIPRQHSTATERAAYGGHHWLLRQGKGKSKGHCHGSFAVLKLVKKRILHDTWLKRTTLVIDQNELIKWIFPRKAISIKVLEIFRNMSCPNLKILPNFFKFKSFSSLVILSHPVSVLTKLSSKKRLFPLGFKGIFNHWS